MTAAALVVIWALAGGRGTLWGAVLGLGACWSGSCCFPPRPASPRREGIAQVVRLLPRGLLGAVEWAEGPRAKPRVAARDFALGGSRQCCARSDVRRRPRRFPLGHSNAHIGVDVIDKHVSAGHGSRPALIYELESGAIERFSFRDIARKSNQLANLLVAHDVGPGDRIAILLPQRPETAISHIAIKAGMIAVPLFTLFGPDALEFRLADSGARALITDTTSLQRESPRPSARACRSSLASSSSTAPAARQARPSTFAERWKRPPIVSHLSTPWPRTQPSSSTPRARPASQKEHCTRSACCSAICRAWRCRMTFSRNPAIISGLRRTGRGSGASSTSCFRPGIMAFRCLPIDSESSIRKRRSPRSAHGVRLFPAADRAQAYAATFAAPTALSLCPAHCRERRRNARP